MKNDGEVPVYVVNDDYTVWGASFGRPARGDGLAHWREDTESLSVVEAERYARARRMDVVRTGHFYRPGSWLDVGEEFAAEKVVRVPRDSDYGELEATLQIDYMRRDRGRLDEEFGSPRFSWDPNDEEYFCPPKVCGELAVYHGRVRHNNNLVNVTRRPRYVTAFWGPASEHGFFISSFDFGRRVLYVYREGIDEAEATREKERFGVATVSANAKLLTAGFLDRPADGGRPGRRRTPRRRTPRRRKPRRRKPRRSLSPGTAKGAGAERSRSGALVAGPVRGDRCPFPPRRGGSAPERCRSHPGRRRPAPAIRHSRPSRCVPWRASRTPSPPGRG